MPVSLTIVVMGFTMDVSNHNITVVALRRKEPFLCVAPISHVKHAINKLEASNLFLQGVFVIWYCHKM
jgi:hypothetical protein